MAKPQVLVLGLDLFDLGYVTSIPDMAERKSFQHQTIQSSTFTLECNNYDYMFTEGNEASFLNGADWLYTSIIIYNEDSEKIWGGIINDIRINDRTQKAYIETKDNLYQYQKNTIEYESNDWETAATAAKAIMDAESFTYYNENAIQNSITNLDNNSCYIKANFNLSDNISLFNAIEMLALYSASDLYSLLGNVYFEHWISGRGATMVINQVDLKTAPIISRLENIMFNDYSLNYDGDGGTAITDSGQNNIGAVSRTKFGSKILTDLRTNDTSQIKFKDSTSAEYIGEQFIYRSHANLLTIPRPLFSIQFDMDIKYRQWITIGTIFKFTYTSMNWTEKKFEVFEFSRNEDNRNINILAYEVI